MQVRLAEGELDRFDRQVRARSIINAVAIDAHALEQRQRDERRDALAIGRDLMQSSAAESHRDRCHRFGRVRSQIIEPHGAAIGACHGIDRLRKLAVVEITAGGRADALERARMIRQADALARVRCATVDRERSAPFGVAAEG